MGSSLYLHTFLILTCFNLYMLTNSYSSMQPLCHEDESSALLQFKHSFVINKTASDDSSAYPKVESWKLDGNSSDCCSWDGVVCDHNSGRVISLDLSSSFLYGSISSNSSLFNLVHLRRLNLADNHFNYSQIPTRIESLSRLRYLDLQSSALSGQIPSSLGNLTRLTFLGLTSNQLQGMIPSSISQLEDLERLFLGFNILGGKLELDIFLKLPHLTLFELSFNHLTVLVTNSTNATLPKFTGLGLSSCNLREFPDFLRFQNKLEKLYFSHNQIHGQIPTWLWNTTKENMLSVNLFGNFLTGFEQSPDLIPWQSVQYLNLGNNTLQGSFPVPPPSISFYKVSNNFLSGEIPPSFCPNSSLSMLLLSNNNLRGNIPQCFTNSSEALLLLDLSSNHFDGIIPQTFTSGIKMIDLSDNQFHGLVPPSLANCAKLQFLVLGNNHIEGTFPYWLGGLPDLQVLMLRFNKFHGAIENLETNLTFPKLRIIDLSYNSFSGNLPSHYFKNWIGMKMVKLGELTYMTANSSSKDITFDYPYSITIAQKGTQRRYQKIQSALVAIDLSNNKFIGEIPESLGSLSGLQLLNVSSNNLDGVIPSSLASLTELESLDVSRNNLSGKIPQQLTQLTFLAVLDVSHNRLTGRIPRGNQFDTFENSSYVGNPGLCGVPLSTSCENSKASPPPLHNSQSDETSFPNGIYWMVIFMGYGSGQIVGLVIGTTLTRRYHEWFVETFGRRKKIQKQQKRKERRN